MNRIHRASVLAVAICGMLSACSTTPERVPILEEARSTVAAVGSMPNANTIASEEMELARGAIATADRYVEEHEDLDLIEHEAYLAKRYAETARALLDAEAAEARIAAAKRERDQVRIEIRERETAEAQARAQGAEARHEAAAAENELLREALNELQAKETERGLVLTLGEVLFETDRAELKPGARSTIDRLAQFLNEQSERRILIEGHTDDQGSESYNLVLSEQRANAVRDALLARGISSPRIMTAGRGESMPVATNDTTAGRQENRRVEIVISDENGRIVGL
jgi:outer membrane protein OmpA-like peptidoglycan-associated protein